MVTTLLTTPQIMWKTKCPECRQIVDLYDQEILPHGKDRQFSWRLCGASNTLITQNKVYGLTLSLKEGNIK